MRKHQQAFTLIELIITLLIFAILIAVAAPKLNTGIANGKSAALGDSFVSELNLARSEAVKRAKRVSICASNDGASCSGSWTDGYIIFVDSATTDDASAPVIDPSVNPNPIIHIGNKPDAGASISVQRNGVDITFIRFTSSGTLAKITTQPAVVAFLKMQKCTDTTSARLITIGIAGMVTVDNKSCL